MDFFEEMVRDMDFRRPRVIITDGMAVLENVTAIVMLSESAVTVSHGRPGTAVFTTVTGTGLVIKEICEGRLLIGGEIQRTEFLQSQSAD